MNTQDKRKFYGKTFARAAAEAKKIFGEDAVFLSRFKEKGMVCIIAESKGVSCSEQEMSNDVKTKNNATALTCSFTTAYPSTQFNIQFPVQPSTSKTNGNFINQDLANQVLISEMGDLKQFISEKLDYLHTSKSNKIQSQCQGLIDCLISQGYTAQFVGQLLAKIPEKISAEFMPEYLANLIANSIILKHNQSLPKKRVKVFYGPAGAGKTQLLGKFMVYSKQQFLHKQNCFIFVNQSNIKTLEEAKAFGRIFDMPSYYVEHQSDFEHFLELSKSKAFTLVELPGIDFQDPSSNSFEDSLNKYRSEIELSLVVAANVSADLLEKYISPKNLLIPDNISITKMDESNRCGALLSHIIENNIPVEYIANGSRFNSPLITSDRQYLKKMILETIRKDEQSKELSKIPETSAIKEKVVNE